VENDYTGEINELQVQVDALVEAEGDPKEIAELEMQLQVLRTIYERAFRLYQDGAGDAELRQHLALRGYGEWDLDNVYAFVYDTTADFPGRDHRVFLGEIRDTDFAQRLR
jgi:hypothetical protein